MCRCQRRCSFNKQTTHTRRTQNTQNWLAVEPSQQVPSTSAVITVITALVDSVPVPTRTMVGKHMAQTPSTTRPRPQQHCAPLAPPTRFLSLLGPARVWAALPAHTSTRRATMHRVIVSCVARASSPAHRGLETEGNRNKSVCVPCGLGRYVPNMA